MFVPDFPSQPGAKIIKLFCSWFTDFRTKLVFVGLDWKNLTNDKHSSLLWKAIINGQKSFISLGPRVMIEGLTCKYKTRLERAARDKHFNLLPTFVNSDRKSFIKH